MTDGDDARGGDRPVAGKVLLLAGPGDATNIVFHALEDAFSNIVLVEERTPSRMALAWRRARRLGWATVAGQVAFVVLAMPLLRWHARPRIAQILSEAHLDPRPVRSALHVASVNSEEAISILRHERPSIVVVHGTRVISSDVLDTVGCPIVNLHAGITPGYRGVHGGYWALAEGRPELAGATVHVVDAGIDTGTVLAQAAFSPTTADSIVSYPYLQLACGLPLLVDQVRQILALGSIPVKSPTSTSTGVPSQLRSHPTVWGYAWRRLTTKVR